MIDLKLHCGLPLNFDDFAEKFKYGEEVTYQSLNYIPLESLIPGLLNKALKYPKVVYVEHRNLWYRDHHDYFQNNGYNFDLVMLPAGLMGVEFIRTHVYFSPAPNTESSSVSEIVEAIKGTLTILLQKNKPKENDWEFGTSVSEGLVVTLSPGEKLALPKGYYYTFINTTGKAIVFSRFYTEKPEISYSYFQKEQGLAYFAIRKNAKREIVLNPRYREIPDVKEVKPDVVRCKAAPDLCNTEPLYYQIMDDRRGFNQFFC